MGRRLTSHRNDETGKYDVMIVTDGADGIPETVEVESSWDQSGEANDRIRELKAEEERVSREPTGGAEETRKKKAGTETSGRQQSPTTAMEQHTRRPDRD